MPKHGESKYLGRRCGRLVVVDTTYKFCGRSRPHVRQSTNSFAVCLCECGRTQQVPMRSFREGKWVCCDWCEMIGTDRDAGTRAFRESGRRIEARERAALATIPAYHRPVDPDPFLLERWMQ
jgi:hypothetical protein